MFERKDIQKLKDEYINYTSYNLPEINSIIYENTNDYLGQTINQEICNGIYNIYLSNSLNEHSEKFQKAILFHEFTHINDLLQIFSLTEPEIEAIMLTYSEAHAEAIKLRYLLNIDLKRKINQGVRYVEDVNGKLDLGTISARYLNTSLEYYKKFKQEKNPEYFKKYIYHFCHYCGYLTIRIPKDTDKLLNGVLEKFPPLYQNKLKELYYAIESKNLHKCYALYMELKLIAMQETI